MIQFSPPNSSNNLCLLFCINPSYKVGLMVLLYTFSWTMYYEINLNWFCMDWIALQNITMSEFLCTGLAHIGHVNRQMLNYLWPPRQQKVGSARINTAFQYKIIFAYLKILLRNFVLQFKFYWANFAYLFFFFIFLLAKSRKRGKNSLKKFTFSVQIIDLRGTIRDEIRLNLCTLTIKSI